MAQNAYSLVAGFTSGLELLLGGIAVAAALRLRRRLRSGSPGAADAVPALFLPGAILAGLALASLPLLYLLLRSLVPLWDGVMCVTGVTRIGTGSEGAARYLPPLLGVLAFTKVALVVATGAWLVVHLVDRRTRTAPLARTVVLLLAVAGGLAVVAASAELAYLGIPKRERFLASGCCTAIEVADLGTRALGLRGAGTAAAGSPATLAYAFFGLSTVAAVGASLGRRAGGARPGRLAWDLGVGVAAVGALVAGGGFLAHVVAPARLGLPDHACVPCLLEAAPEMGVGIALGLGGAACVAWSTTLARTAAGTEAEGAAGGVLRGLLGFASFAFAAAALMGATAWWVA